MGAWVGREGGQAGRAAWKLPCSQSVRKAWLDGMQQRLGFAPSQKCVGSWPTSFSVLTPDPFLPASALHSAEVTYSVQIGMHTPGWLQKLIRCTHVLTVRQRLQVPAQIADQSVVSGWWRALPWAEHSPAEGGELGALLRRSRVRCTVSRGD